MKHVEQGQFPNLQMGLVLKHFFEDHPSVVDRAGREFFEYVQARQDVVSKEKIEQLFREWLVYDFRLKTGKTAFETYIYRNPDGLSADELSLLQQASDSHFTSHFWVGAVEQEHNLLIIEECHSQKQYSIYDMTAPRHVRSNVGWVAARLIQLTQAGDKGLNDTSPDGKSTNWYFASDPVFFVPVVWTPEMKQRMTEVPLADKSTCVDGVPADGRQPFIDIVKMHYGLNDKTFEEFDIVRSGQIMMPQAHSPTNTSENTSQDRTDTAQ